ncbi:MAG: hypothetical protein MRY72_07025 [Aquisalinus sp.]|nr:hypothetical protein [Aquisalinus sp.]
MKSLPAAMAAFVTTILMLPALASQPEDKGYAFQDAATPLAEEVHFFHNWVLMPVITFISLFVLALLAWVILRYNSKANPVPAKFSHNTFIEVVWTVIPIFILIYIALFSFDLLYKEDVIPDGKVFTYEGDGQTTEFAIDNDFPKSRQVANRDHVDVYKVNLANGAMAKLKYRDDYTIRDLRDPVVTVVMNEALRPSEGVKIVAGRSRTGPRPFWGEDRSVIVPAPTITIKASGRQWGWDYAYPDFGDFEFASNIMPEDQVSDPRLWLLETDTNVVVPEGETIRIITTAIDVIHSWTIPAFSIKIDAVPGRLNETWFQAPAYKPNGNNKYYGQCSEICGIDHAYMPITVEVMPREQFNAWVDEQRDFNGMEPMFAESDETPKFAAAVADTADQLQD